MPCLYLFRLLSLHAGKQVPYISESVPVVFDVLFVSRYLTALVSSPPCLWVFLRDSSSAITCLCCTISDAVVDSWFHTVMGENARYNFS